MNSPAKYVAALAPVLVAAALCAATGAWAAETYVGPSAAYGSAVPAGSGSGNQRADQAASLTYIFVQPSYTVTATGTITVEDVNFANQSAGTIIPFLAVYLGGATNTGSDYQLLTVGDAFTVGAGTSSGVLVNNPFTVGGVNPTIAVTAGEVLVAGVYQSSTNVVFASGAENVLIDNGNTIPGSTGSDFASGANYYFSNQLYRFDIGFVDNAAPVPEPASGPLMAGAVLAAAILRRRLRSAAV